jgi:hypothetical protein
MRGARMKVGGYSGASRRNGLFLNRKELILFCCDAVSRSRCILVAREESLLIKVGHIGQQARKDQQNIEEEFA